MNTIHLEILGANFVFFMFGIKRGAIENLDNHDSRHMLKRRILPFSAPLCIMSGCIMALGACALLWCQLNGT